MKQSINLSQFREAFAIMERKEKFSYEGQERLYNYLEDEADSTGTEHEFNVIALCCEYSEQPYTAIAQAYSIDIEGMDELDASGAVIDWLNDNTLVIASCDVDNILYNSEF